MAKKKKPVAGKSCGSDIRGKINVSALIEALEQHVISGKKMSATQVRAAIALLKKILPDMSGAGQEPERESTLAHEEALSELE